MSYIFTYKCIALLIIHSRVLYATLYLPNDKSQPVDDINDMNDASKQTNDETDHNFVLLTVYKDKTKKSYVDDRNIDSVVKKIVSRNKIRNSHLQKPQDTTSSSETTDIKYDESINYALRSYLPSVQHNLDQAEDMSQYIHRLNNWYNSRLKTVIVNEKGKVINDTQDTSREDNTVPDENVLKKKDDIAEGKTLDFNEKGTIKKVTEDTIEEDNTVTDENVVKNKDNIAGGKTVDVNEKGSVKKVTEDTIKEDYTITDENMVKNKDSIAEGNTVDEKDEVSSKCEKDKVVIVIEPTVDQNNKLSENNSIKKENKIKAINDRNRKKKLRNYCDYSKKRGRYMILPLRSGNRQLSKQNKIKRQRGNRIKNIRFRTNRNRKGKPRFRLGGVQNTNGVNTTTRSVKNTTKTTKEELNSTKTTRKEVRFSTPKESRSAMILNASRQRRVDKIMDFLKDNMMSTMYVYHELKRIEKTHEVRDQVRKMIWVMEQPHYQQLNLRENVLNCYRGYFHKIAKEMQIWNKPTNNLVQYLVQDYINDGL